jgi:hypothetical protein
MLTRENQMLRLRIRELERQIGDLSSLPANAPVTPSGLGVGMGSGMGGEGEVEMGGVGREGEEEGEGEGEKV